MERNKIKVEIEVEEKWIPYLIKFFKDMESFGKIGHSELIGFYADGDGTFHPKFTFDKDIDTDSVDAKQSYESSIKYYDLG